MLSSTSDNRSASRPAPPNAEILVFATNMVQAADIVEKDLLGIVSRKVKRGLSLSKSGAAYPLLEYKGQLLTSRLRQET